MENKVRCSECAFFWPKTSFCVSYNAQVDDAEELSICKKYEELPEEYRTQAKMLAEMGARKNGNK